MKRNATGGGVCLEVPPCRGVPSTKRSCRASRGFILPAQKFVRFTMQPADLIPFHTREHFLCPAP